ncbi:MAG: hypothetical protein L0154_08240 [Chloroflexi bacterium]|nr:hypothetical protein [Chloroflexota bacterium]
MTEDQLIAELENGCSVRLEDALGTYWMLFYDNGFYLQLVTEDDQSILENHKYDDLDECLEDAAKLAPFSQWTVAKDC